MSIVELRRKFIQQLTEHDYDEKFIHKISNDIAMLAWIEHCLSSKEYNSISDLFEDAGFIEGMEMQHETPLKIEEMNFED